MVVAVILVRREEKEEERLREDHEGRIPAARKGIKGDQRERKTERGRKIERKTERETKIERETGKNAHQIVDDTMRGTTPPPNAPVQTTERRKSNGQNPVGSLKENEHLDTFLALIFVSNLCTYHAHHKIIVITTRTVARVQSGNKSNDIHCRVYRIQELASTGESACPLLCSHNYTTCSV